MQSPKKTIVTIDDRFLLFALDRMYRKAMQGFERTTLLVAARRVAEVLHVAVPKVLPEGYYATDKALTEYFQLMRALQDVSESRRHEVISLAEFQQLWEVSSSRIYGHPETSDTLLPKGIDALAHALRRVRPEWTIARILPAARLAALEADDYSLVGLAARIEDAIVLTALRESVVLYAHRIAFGRPPMPTLEWTVNLDLAREANRFVEAFNALVPNALPPVLPENAKLFYDPDWHVGEVAGRCVSIGTDPGFQPTLYYHWAICEASPTELTVQEFWSDELWTTERYLARRTRDRRCVD